MPIRYYEKFLSDELLAKLKSEARPVPGISGLNYTGAQKPTESLDALKFLCSLYERVKKPLDKVLSQRELDRSFIDERTKSCLGLNKKLGIDYTSADYQTVLGQEDAHGQVVFGPLNPHYYQCESQKQISPLPVFLNGPHVTLFGPPDDVKLSINAMNAFHRKLKGEPEIVSRLVENQPWNPMWGADDEDSKTPLHEDLILAAQNLTGCFEKTISYQDPKTKKAYALEKERLALPIKRFPGLALPSVFLLYQEEPVPLHLYDFALHLFQNWKNSEALCFYVPKLETVEEAAYIRMVMETAEEQLKNLHPEYQIGSIRLFIVLENPRLIFRTHELMDALFPYFAGASLGWHDYLSSTARLFKNDSHYRIPVKADPDIVIKYIKASHELLADVVGPRGGVKIGGMYGVLPIDTDLFSPSFQVTIKGFIRDVITQMKRNLSGFWVAHPDFVRIGLALVEGWRRYSTGEDKSALTTLVTALLDKKYHQEILDFIEGSDMKGLDKTSPLYARSLIVADLKESTFIANNHPDEIRYNVFQSLQYLTDWLSGNGCVALPSTIEGIPVRVMDDLATAERSRWEVWHEIHHRRFLVEDFLRIAHEELLFIRKDFSDGKKIVQVKWDERTEKWYPIALEIMIKLMTDENPCEFASELLLPFTIETIRNSASPLDKLKEICPNKYKIAPYIDRWSNYFAACGATRFASTMAQCLEYDSLLAKNTILSFSIDEIKQAASFHGDIGESKKTLDKVASQEQKLVQDDTEAIKNELKSLGEKYKSKHGIKFLISAKGKTASQILENLKSRISNSQEQELQNARQALWEITEKRLISQASPDFFAEIESLMQQHKVEKVQLSISTSLKHRQNLAFSTTNDTYFELASLSKTIGACYALESLRAKGIGLDSYVNELLAKANANFRIPNGDTVQVRHLLNHTALNLHYVNGIPLTDTMPTIDEFLNGNSRYGYEPITASQKPGEQFQYSGGGFLVLEYLINLLEKSNLEIKGKEFFLSLGIEDLSFVRKNEPKVTYATENRKMFPLFAAGMMGTAKGMTNFLSQLTEAFHDKLARKGISHDTAVQMLFGQNLGSREFMGADMGLGVFTVEAGNNRIMIHQGANDGYRCLFIYCYSGPDKHKGFTLFCTGDDNGSYFIAEVAEKLLQKMQFQGVKKIANSPVLDLSKVPQEQRVNRVYKAKIFDAFEPTLPEAIVVKGTRDPLSAINLAVTAKVLSCSNEKFARAENLLSAYLPIFDPELYGEQGKIMDSWETVRHNPKSCDELFLELKEPSKIACVSISTQFHDGNHAEYFKLEGKIKEEWVELIPKTKLEGHSLLYLKVHDTTDKFQVLKLSNYPDGGISRLGLFHEVPKGCVMGQSLRFKEPIPQPKKPLAPKYAVTDEKVKTNFERLKGGQEFDVACAAYGGRILSASNEHYSPAHQALSPFSPIHMFDGFESARSRTPNHSENAVIKLGRPSQIHAIELDFTYFRNNNPREVSIETLNNNSWETIVPKTAVKAYAGNQIRFELKSPKSIEQIRVNVYPDGGIHRVRAMTYAK